MALRRRGWAEKTCGVDDGGLLRGHVKEEERRGRAEATLKATHAAHQIDLLACSELGGLARRMASRSSVNRPHLTPSSLGCAPVRRPTHAAPLSDDGWWRPPAHQPPAAQILAAEEGAEATRMPRFQHAVLRIMGGICARCASARPTECGPCCAMLHRRQKGETRGIRRLKRPSRACAWGDKIGAAWDWRGFSPKPPPACVSLPSREPRGRWAASPAPW